jgi:alpha-D-xyloside xylohydrolase
MLRTLFFEYPEDPTSWLIEDEYMFGSDILVAPLFEQVNEREVYLPPGLWVDYQSKAAYHGGKWHKIKAGAIPCVILVKNGTVLPHLALSQSTVDMDWTQIDLKVYGSAVESRGLLCLPPEASAQGGRTQDKVLRELVVAKRGTDWELVKGAAPKVKFTIKES